jgi:hypothetical protein
MRINVVLSPPTPTLPREGGEGVFVIPAQAGIQNLPESSRPATRFMSVRFGNVLGSKGKRGQGGEVFTRSVEERLGRKLTPPSRRAVPGAQKNRFLSL